MHKANVITVLHNNVATLEGYFDGLVSQGDTIARVVLVDNASTDNSIETATRLAAHHSLDVVVVEHTNAGFAGGYARGGREQMDFALPTLCLNPDVALAPDTVRALLQALASDDRAAIITSPLVTETGEEDSASRRVLPSLGKAAVYAVLGKLTPRGLRYNDRSGGPDVALVVKSNPTLGPSSNALPTSQIEATTGALMLVSPTFRPADVGIFDQDYWMYGEDLQICFDARAAGLRVVMVEGPPSLHLKGASSGRPRGRVSNIAFHRAMYIYYSKNLNVHPLGKVIVGGAIFGRLGVQLVVSRASRTLKRNTSTRTPLSVGHRHE
jgi:N-acetylglucosaminyl-diphospho-decaprenol L-rhamnosyltransferase